MKKIMIAVLVLVTTMVSQPSFAEDWSTEACIAGGIAGAMIGSRIGGGEAKNLGGLAGAVLGCRVAAKSVPHPVPVGTGGYTCVENCGGGYPYAYARSPYPYGGDYREYAYQRGLARAAAKRRQEEARAAYLQGCEDGGGCSHSPLGASRIMLVD